MYFETGIYGRSSDPSFSSPQVAEVMSTYLDGSYFLRIASISVACYEYVAAVHRHLLFLKRLLQVSGNPSCRIQGVPFYL